MSGPSGRWPHALATVLLFAVLAACGNGEGTDDRTGRASTDPTITTPPPATNSSTPVPVLRLGDTGAEVALAVGGSATVSLPSSHPWEEPIVTGAAVTVSEDVSDEPAASRSWTVTARQAGTATVTLTGSPACRSKTPPCDRPDVMWSARFTVS